MRGRCCRGFTLLEVLVALMIFATAAVALTRSLTQSADSTGALEQRQFADLAAHNLMVAYLRERANPNPGIGSGGAASRKQGKDSLAGFDFNWSRELSPTAHPNILRVDISIRLAGEEDILASRSAFVGK